MKHVEKPVDTLNTVNLNALSSSTMTIAIDLVWWNVGHMGGVESFIKNLLRGISDYSTGSFLFIILASEDNASFIESLGLSDVFKIRRMKTNSDQKIRTLLYQYFNICSVAAELGADLLFVPTAIYPIRRGKIPTIVTVHDLQFLHFPEYATFFQNAKYRWCWNSTLRSADKIVAISNFVKQDIIEKLGANPKRIEVIYNPIKLSEEKTDFSLLSDRYRIMSREYLYTVSSMAPHKNLKVLIKLLSELKRNNYEGIPNRLVISGIRGSQEKELRKLVDELDVSDSIIFTGFISDMERDSLYENAYAFLFPSTFEGFGMPPVEALMLGTPVITTRCASIPEITKHCAVYVDNPYSEIDWLKKLKELVPIETKNLRFEEYSMGNSAKAYLSIFRKVFEDAVGN